MIERRRQKRVNKELRIVWKNENVAFDSVTLDICPGGMFVVTNRLLAPKSIIDVELWLSPVFSVKCHGEVVWVNRGEVIHYPQGFGVQFLDISEKALNHLLLLCTEQEEGLEEARGE